MGHATHPAILGGWGYGGVAKTAIFAQKSGQSVPKRVAPAYQIRGSAILKV